MKLTAKGLKDRFECIGIGYGGAHHLLGGELKLGYTTSNYYGWRSDNYLVKVELEEGSKYVIVSTGYSPVSNVKVNNQSLEMYEDTARIVYENQGITYQERVKRIKVLLNDLLVQTLEGASR